MAASGCTQQFRSILHRVAETMTTPNVKKLAFLCEDISTCRREGITNAIDLFTVLQGLGLLSSRKVDLLIGWLDELQLLEASTLLKDYRGTHLKENDTTCIDQEHQPITYFCMSCDQKVCPDCVIQKHNSAEYCDFIKLDDISDEVRKRQLNLIQAIESAEISNSSAEKRWKEKKDFFSKCREEMRSKISKDSLSLIADIHARKRDLMGDIDNKEISDMKKLMKEQQNIQGIGEGLECISKLKIQKSRNTLDDLQEINRGLKKIKFIQQQLDEQNDLLNNQTIDLLYRKIPNDGVFCIITVSILIGSVGLHENQLLHIFDERQSNGGVLLVCIDPDHHRKEYWRHLEKIDNDHDPIVMSHLTMFYDCKKHALFAVGNKVFVVHPHKKCSSYDYIESISSFVIREVHEGSWISSVAAHCPNDDENDEFVISTNRDHSLREYNVSASALRVINTGEFVLSNAISRVAYCGDMFAIIGRGLHGVILIHTDGNKTSTWGTLMLPSSLSGMLPINMIWTGLKWLVLYVSDVGEEKEWRVVNYAKTGMFSKVCDERRSTSVMDVPVSINRWCKTGYVTLTNASVLKFDY